VDFIKRLLVRKRTPFDGGERNGLPRGDQQDPWRKWDGCDSVPPTRSTEPFWLEVSRASPNQDERPAPCGFSMEFRQRRPGMRFDVLTFGSRRINGVRNFRQALASPHPAVRFTIRRGPF
jgi:hypothetical protein